MAVGYAMQRDGQRPKQDLWRCRNRSLGPIGSALLEQVHNQHSKRARILGGCWSSVSEGEHAGQEAARPVVTASRAVEGESRVSQVEAGYWPVVQSAA